MANYDYFISYNFCSSNGTKIGFGNYGYALFEEITSMKQIEEIENTIAAQRGYDLCVMTSFQLLKKED